MKRATNNEQSTFSADAPPRKLLPYAWPLFTAVWLLFPAGFVVQVLRTGLPPVQLLAFLASLAAFVGVFLCLMLRYSFPAESGSGSSWSSPPSRSTSSSRTAAASLTASCTSCLPQR